ncbi:hypothetical protein LF41_2110 [Lysobacter dokdonensis DS-58]|uniref:Uncharacterized protein n=1 Tax=Lysobacter dokdonensis DS-58 TaxID=1300345 RepID=A0A0A2WJ19_9GAMM|nr:NHLP-related RiPP peptide [Lysobacter dokdonensis]KGQ20156.1 hypothetical protein LF41_2110 [Lysobacter dokdonensis DS-58]
MAMKKGGPTEELDPKVVRTLLDRLSTDDDFRELFQNDAHAALVEAGWKAPASAAASLAPVDQAKLSGGSCLMKSGATLASKEDIAAARPQLERTLAAIINFDAPRALYND